MRLLLVALVALALAGTAVAAPGKARFSVPLTPIASKLAGKPVQVFCGAHPLIDREFLGFTPVVGGRDTYLDPDACTELVSQLRGRPIDWRWFSESLRGLIHETMHLRGIRDEAEADCAALRLFVGVARREFLVRPLSRVRKMLAFQRQTQHELPPEYQGAC